MAAAGSRARRVPVFRPLVCTAGAPLASRAAQVDLVNLRSETYAADSRIPTMAFGTAEQDAMRRDFTVNSLFYNINTVRPWRGWLGRHHQQPLSPHQRGAPPRLRHAAAPLLRDGSCVAPAGVFWRPPRSSAREVLADVAGAFLVLGARGACRHAGRARRHVVAAGALALGAVGVLSELEGTPGHNVGLRA